MLNRLITPAAACLIFATAACSERFAGQVLSHPQSQQDSPPEKPPEGSLSWVTIVNATQVTTDEAVRTSCFLTDGIQHYRATSPVVVEVDPRPDRFEQVAPGSGVTASFFLAVAGVYNVRCVSPDGEFESGPAVQVSAFAAAPSRWVVSFDDLACFHGGDILNFVYTAYDELGNEMDEGAYYVDAEVVPSDGVVGNLDVGFSFRNDGDYTITLNIVSALAPGADIQPVRAYIHADTTPPTLEILSPGPGAMLQRGESSDTMVDVTVVASDSSSSIDDIRIDGESVPISGDSQSEQVTGTTRSAWGLSVTTARASDACGNIAFLTRPFLRSGEYYPAGTAAYPAARVHNALVAQVSQALIDDGDRSDIDDFATLAQRALANIDYNTLAAPGEVLVDRPVRQDCNFCFGGPTYASVGALARRHPDASRPVLMSPPSIDYLRALNGAFSFGATFRNFSFPLHTRVSISQCAVGCETFDEFDVNVTVGFSELVAQGVIGADLYGGKARGSVENINFEMTGTFIQIECGSFQWACDDIVDLLIDTVTDRVEIAVEDAVRELVPERITDAINSYGVESTIELEAPLSTTLGVAAGLDVLSLCGPASGALTPVTCGAHNTHPGSMQLGLYTQIFPTRRSPTITANPRGPMRSSRVDVPKFNSSQTSYGLGVRTDLMNQLFWSLWYSGAFQFDDLAQVMTDSELEVPSGFSGSLEMGLPPVLMPGGDDSLFRMGLGDVRLHAVVDAGALVGTGSELISMDLTFSAIVGVSVEVDAEAQVLLLTAAPDLEIYFEVHQISDVTYSSYLGALLSDLMARELSDNLKDSVREMPIPEFDLGSIDGVPAGTAWVQKEAYLDSGDGYLSMRGILGLRQ